MNIQDLTLRTTEFSTFEVMVCFITAILYLFIYHKTINMIKKEKLKKLKIFILILPIIYISILGLDIYCNTYYPKYYIGYKQVEIKVDKNTYYKIKNKISNEVNSKIQKKELKEFIKKMK